MKKEQEIKEMDTNMKELNLNEMEMADGGYIVDRGFWHDYWVVSDWDGKIIYSAFLKHDARIAADVNRTSEKVISEATYNDWMAQREQQEGPFFNVSIGHS